MKRLISWAVIAAMVFALPSCGNDDEGKGKKPAAPSISLVGADIDAVHEITPTMSVKVAVEAKGSIADFQINIESPALTSDLLGALGLATQMNLVTPANDAMANGLESLGFPVRDNVKQKQSLSFDISTLIPMIAAIYDKNSDHNFVLTVTDAEGQRTAKTLKFHLTGTNSVTYNNDADLWANTASFAVKVAEVTSEVEVEYKKSGETSWQQATVTANEDGTYKASIVPSWVAAPDHASGAKQFTLDNTKGVFAGQTYEYRLLVGGEVVEGAEGTFTTEAGQKIPGGDMETWSKSSAWDVDNMYDGKQPVFYPNAEGGAAFWASGNNAMTPELCLPDTLANNTYAAKLKGKFMVITFAAGNLFTGIFDFKQELSGYARFGQKYAFAARPSALKLRYKATITNFTYISSLKEGELTLDMIDKARFFVCITDWKERHSVMSGMGALAEGGKDKINAFDPEVSATTAEGAVLAYGSKWFETSTAGSDWVELVIPIIYKENAKEVKPSADKYSLVISSASSAYGDFLCGSENNELHLDTIEWVF